MWHDMLNVKGKALDEVGLLRKPGHIVRKFHHILVYEVTGSQYYILLFHIFSSPGEEVQEL